MSKNKGMGITWSPEEEVFAAIEQLFLQIGKDAVSMNHYDLSGMSRGRYTPEECRQFLIDPRVMAYTKKEFTVIRDSEFRKVITGIGDGKSVGQAQILSTLNKIIEPDSAAMDGPVFVYSYVPLSSAQEQAENVVKLTNDPFLRTQEDDDDTTPLSD